MNAREQLLEAISNACRENVHLRFGENSVKIMESGGRLGLSGGEADEVGRCALQALSDLGAVVLMPVKEGQSVANVIVLDEKHVLRTTQEERDEGLYVNALVEQS